MARFFNMFRRKRAQLEQDLARELQYHIDRRIDDMQKSGLTESEARRQALLEFGNVPQVQEEVRETWTWRWLDTLIADTRYALRGLVRDWGFSLATVSVLAIGIGATVAMFSVINTTLLRPLSYPDADRIMSLATTSSSSGHSGIMVSGPDFLDWQARSKLFDKMAVSSSGSGSDLVTVVNDRAVFANARFVSADFFAVFGQQVFTGRGFSSSDMPTGNAEPGVAIAAYHWAVAHFGTAQQAVGKTIVVYGTPMKLIGVAAIGFRFPDAADLWAPTQVENSTAARNADDYTAVGKLKQGVTVAAAQNEMRQIGETLAKEFAENRFKSVVVMSLQDRLTGSVQTMMWLLMTSVFAVLLIACMNISNLLLARASVRTREIALRAALGAGRRRLVRQLLTESGVLALVAGGAGVLLSLFFVKALVALSPSNIPRLGEVRIDLYALAFASLLSFASAMLFGLVPALHASRLDLSGILKQGGSTGATSGTGPRPRPRATLVVAEVALSVMLLTAAGLLLQSFTKLQHVDLGFTTDRVLVAYMEYATGNDAEIRARSAFYENVLERIRAVPGVRSAAGVSYLGMGKEIRTPRDYFVQGHPEGAPGERPQTEFHAVTPEYFRTLEIPVRAGREFDRSDSFDAPHVAIINESLARQAFPGKSPLGQRIRTSNRSEWMPIVGVVADTRWQDPGKTPPPVLFVSTLQGWGKSPSIIVRTTGEETALIGTIAEIVRQANSSVPVRFETMDQLVADAVAHPRFRTQLIGAFAIVAALLAAIGIFSVLAYLVGQRTREIAVRLAVGADTRDIIRLVAGQGMKLVATGLCIGSVAAIASARLLAGMLYEITPWSVGPYLASVGVIGSAALLATVVPALRAANIMPVVALQQD